MSRRPISTLIARNELALNRKVPHASMWSESRINQHWSRVGSMGEESTQSNFFVEASFAEAEWIEPSEGYFECRLRGSEYAFTSEPVNLADIAPLPAHTRIRFTFLEDVSGEYNDVEVTFFQGDGYSQWIMDEGAYGYNPSAWTGSLVGTTPPPYGILIDPDGLITP